ncbi:MAG: hypothetical protein P9L99_21765 [Candidatus Lernaella stagnicola]|nr:hypothetical protein [Candidatus Lernaella stagnicola]
MVWRKTTMLLIVTIFMLGLAMPAAAAKKKKGKKKRPDRVEQQDPWANRWGLSFGGGGVSSSAGFGFEGRVGVTYYINRYFHLTLSPGFGTYPIDYDSPDGTETTYIKYVPVDLSLIVTPIRFSSFSPYFGPGVGVTYFWWTEKVRDPDDPKETIDEDQNETLYPGFLTAGVSSSVGGPFVLSVGVTYTIPNLQEFNTDDGYLTFGFGGGVVF